MWRNGAFHLVRAYRTFSSFRSIGNNSSVLPWQSLEWANLSFQRGKHGFEFTKTESFTTTPTTRRKRHLSTTPKESVKRVNRTTPHNKDPEAVDEEESFGVIYKPPPNYKDTIENETVRNSIRCSISGYRQHEDHSHYMKDTGMSIIFLGTSAGIPTKTRSTSATLLRLGGKSFLFDAGEGVQRQLAFTRAKLSHIQRIFITHLHGDHIYGLPGFLLGLQQSIMVQRASAANEQPQQDLDEEGEHDNQSTSSRRRSRHHRTDDTTLSSSQQKEPHVIQIYGPPGLYNYVAANVILSCTLFHSIHIQVYELVGGRVRRIHGTPNGIPNPFEAHYPEFQFGCLTRHTIPCQDGIWTIHDFPKQKSINEVLQQPSSSSSDTTATTAPAETEASAETNTTTSSSTTTSTTASSSSATQPLSSSSTSSSTTTTSRQTEKSRGVRIFAAEVDHLSGVATFGYVMEEDEPPRNLDIERARALGVSAAGGKFQLLKEGFSVTSDDGTTLISPSQVWKHPRTKKARKVAIVGDNRGWTKEMKRLAQHAEVLIHEATLTEEDWKRGHSTAGMAGKVAASVNAKLLILNHISSKSDLLDHTGKSRQRELIEQAKQGYRHQQQQCQSQKQDENPQKGQDPANQHNHTRTIMDVLIAYDFLEILVPWMGFGPPQTLSSSMEEESITTTLGLMETSSSPSTNDGDVNYDDSTFGVQDNGQEVSSSLSSTPKHPMETRAILKKWFTFSGGSPNANP